MLSSIALIATLHLCTLLPLEFCFLSSVCPQVRELIAVALGLKHPPVPLGHIAGTFHIETEEGTYRGRFLAPVSVKAASEPGPQKPEILMLPLDQPPPPPPTAAPVFMVGQAFGSSAPAAAAAGRPEIEPCA